MGKRKLILLSISTLFGLIIICLLLFFYFTPSRLGQVISVHQSTGKENDSIWIADGFFDNKEISNKTEDELEDIYRNKGSVVDIPWYIPDSLIKKIKSGTKVKIYFNGRFKESSPAQASAYWISIIND